MDRDSIFPILRESYFNEQKSKNYLHTYTKINSKKKSKQQRKTRFDKTHTMRFPVTEQQERLLKIFYKSYKSQLNVESITEFTTMLLRFGLRHTDLFTMIDEDYKDTKKYKTVKPNQIEYEMISGVNGFAIQWNISERRALYRIMMSVLLYLTRGGTISYEEIQPIRPSK